jgi:DNA-binding NarL/FixJ family response regulator
MSELRGPPRQLPEEATEHGPVRLVLIDNDEIIRAGLHALLARHRGRVDVVGQISPNQDVAAAATQLRPDVILVHVGSQQAGALDLAGELVRLSSSWRVAVLSEATDERWLFEALRRGVTAYLSRSLNSSQLVEALVQVSEGTPVVDPDLATTVALRAAYAWHGHGWPGSWLGLSRRQSEVLRLLTDGLSNQRIAEQLVVGEETVKTHLRHIYRKLGVQDRTQAVALALRQGLFDSDGRPVHRTNGQMTAVD